MSQNLFLCRLFEGVSEGLPRVSGRMGSSGSSRQKRRTQRPAGWSSAWTRTRTRREHSGRTGSTTRPYTSGHRPGPRSSRHSLKFGLRARMCTARIFVQGLCIVARAAAPLAWAFPVVVVGLVAVGGEVAAAVASSSGVGRFAVGVRVGLGSCVFGCGLVLLPSLALFGLAPGPRTLLRLERKSKSIVFST